MAAPPPLETVRRHLDKAQDCVAGGRTREAIGHYLEALGRLELAEIHVNVGALYREKGDLAAAVAHFRRALILKPDSPLAACNLGNALIDTGEVTEAVACLEGLLGRSPDLVAAHLALGHAHQCLGRFEAARRSYETAVSLAPDDPEGYNGLGVVFSAQGRLDLAAANYRRALDRDPRSARACNNLANVLRRQGKIEEALHAYEAAVRIDPDFAGAYANALAPLLEACAWERAAAYAARLDTLDRRRPQEGIFALEGPLVSLQRSDDPARHLRIARRRAAAVARRVPRPSGNRTAPASRDRAGRLTVGYLSGNFNRHPVAFQIGGLFRCHDRNRFRTVAYATSPDDGSAVRAKIRDGCDIFRDLTALDHDAAAGIVRRDGVDILVDLMGHTRGNRLEIAARRPAPIIVSYLGFLASTGADFIDYLICDRIVVPPAHLPHYTEKPVYLPHCYQVNDDRLEISPRPFTRRQAGLPEDRFVFCSFNNPAKIDPEVFSAWMAVLRTVDGSVLWLQGGEEITVANQREAARRHRVDPARLVHAPTLPLPDHLARLRLADLALDTFRYNGGATTSNALWAGVPVVAALGGDFVSRMSASALYSAGLPELVCADAAAYTALAIDLAKDPHRLGVLRRRLATARRNAPLFDTPRFVEGLEKAYLEMWRICCRNEPPRMITVGEENQNLAP